MLTIDQNAATELLRHLVEIPSLSREETDASHWLVSEMQQLGYERAYVDAAGNAVGEMGPEQAENVVILLGHIDTVPGSIAVRTEGAGAERVLYGRGTVDAKGPLATFVVAGARLGSAWAREHNTLLLVVGAVEEEAATSKGARYIRDCFDGVRRSRPEACIIGEPSGWQRVTLGYKGRLLVDMTASQPMAHTAGPDAGVATLAVDLWKWIEEYATQYNVDKSRNFEQLQPSLREVNTAIDNAMLERVSVRIGVRLPQHFDALEFGSDLMKWLVLHIEAEPDEGTESDGLLQGNLCLTGKRVAVTVAFHGYEPAWRAERGTLLVRSFLAAIREIDASVHPSFVVKTGTSDMNVVAPAWQCPVLAYGPGDSRLDHTPDEHINLDEYWRAILVLEKSLHNFAILMDHSS